MKSPTQRRTGILGGGQLARMLIQQGQKLGLEMHVLCERQDDPAAQVTSHWHRGSPTNRAELRKFLAKMDVVAFESEFLDSKLLTDLQKTYRNIKPAPKLMGLLQDRLSQKRWLEKNKIPTTPFVSVSKFSDIPKAQETLGHKFVLKKRRFGYDGYGTFICDNQTPALKKVIQSSSDGFIAEQFVPFKRELAVVIARNSKNQFAIMPLVESHQQESRCLWVKGPAKHPKYASMLTKIKTALNKSNYIGAVAFEFFDTGKTLLVNEVAPRVHNTGHYSLDGLSEDQFTLHLKAIWGENISSPSPLARGFAMMNLLGEKIGEKNRGKKNLPKWPLKVTEKVALHWYGKKENRPGRKMGHINSIGSSPDKALSIVKKARKEFSL